LFSFGPFENASTLAAPEFSSLRETKAASVHYEPYPQENATQATALCKQRECGFFYLRSVASPVSDRIPKTPIARQIDAKRNRDEALAFERVFTKA
jgi:hypothetical protein